MNEPYPDRRAAAHAAFTDIEHRAAVLAAVAYGAFADSKPAGTCGGLLASGGARSGEGQKRRPRRLTLFPSDGDSSIPAK